MRTSDRTTRFRGQPNLLHAETSPVAAPIVTDWRDRTLRRTHYRYCPNAIALRGILTIVLVAGRACCRGLALALVLRSGRRESERGMTISVTEATRSAISTSPLSAVATALSLVTIFLLVTLLLEKEFYRFQGKNWKQVARALDIAVVPLTVAVTGILLYRVLRIIDVL